MTRKDVASFSFFRTRRLWQEIQLSLWLVAIVLRCSAPRVHHYSLSSSSFALYQLIPLAGHPPSSILQHLPASCVLRPSPLQSPSAWARVSFRRPPPSSLTGLGLSFCTVKSPPPPTIHPLGLLLSAYPLTLPELIIRFCHVSLSLIRSIELFSTFPPSLPSQGFHDPAPGPGPAVLVLRSSSWSSSSSSMIPCC